MPLEIVRNDITKMKVDAIVNAAKESLLGGGGVDGCIHRAAGPELLAECAALGGCRTGDAKLTKAYRLPCKYVIHTVGPVWKGGSCGEEGLLRSCYENSLKLALENGCHSVAFPLIATNNYGFPKDLALQIAIYVFSAFLLHHDMQIYLVVWDRGSYKLSEKLFHHVACYIDEHYIDSHLQFPSQKKGNTRFPPGRYSRKELDCAYACEESFSMPSLAAPQAASLSLEDMLRNTDAGFTETLLKLIDQAGKKDSEIYKKAALSKQHFSKIRNNPEYRPTKATAIALALALELDVEQTNDLIGRAGYTLSNSSKFDVIIRYFIESYNFNVVEINVALYEFDQPLLGA
jgi:O-acetyl-ADP-ribose deacetylase (regulator of RNase III)